MTTGIYKLIFNNTNKIYIGKSLCIEERYNTHLRTFNDRSAAKKLLQAYDTYGKPSISILEICTAATLSDRETYYINAYNVVEDGFNTQKVSDEMPRLYGEEHPQSLYSNRQIEEVFLNLIQYKLTHQEIADLTKVSKNMVNAVAAGTCHAWLRDDYPKEYADFFNNKPAYGNSKERGKVYPTIKDPNGIVYDNIDNIRKFSREHNLPYSSLNSLLNFRCNSTKGWTRL